MHILFLTDNFPPEVNAPATRTLDHASVWVEAGHQVTIITCVPNFPIGKVFKGYKNKPIQVEYINNIRVIRVWSYVAPNEGFAKRILDFLSFMISSFLAGMTVRNVDVVVGTSPQFFTGISACAIALLKRRPFVFEVRDLWPESLRAVGVLRNNLIFKMLEKIEHCLYRKASQIVVVTNSFKKHLVNRGIEEEKIHVVTNGIDTKKFKPRSKDTNLLQELSLLDKFVVGYIGTHGMAHSLETVIESATILSASPQHEDIIIIMLGDGASRDDLLRKAEGLKNIKFIRSVSKSEVSNYWSILDASIVHLKKNSLFETVIPSKIFESMGMGIPILHGVQGESADIIKRYNAGILFEPESAQSLTECIKNIHSDPKKRVELKEGGLSAVEKFDRDFLARKMLEVFAKAILPLQQPK